MESTKMKKRRREKVRKKLEIRRKRGGRVIRKRKR